MIYVIIAVTFFGFIGLAFVLLFPVYRFLSREEKLSEDWTPDAIARKQSREAAGGDGAPSREEAELPS
ncbi:MAG: hypothetical protein Rubg2KO_36140 [Rubricoccaceae bacterium]